MCALYQPIELASVAQLDPHPTNDQEVEGLTPLGRQHFIVETDHELFSKVIFSLLLIQEEVVSFWRRNVLTTG